jgi:hypothetical protein
LKMKQWQNYFAICFCLPLETYHIRLSSILTKEQQIRSFQHLW